LGPDYDKKVLPAIVNEITRSVVAQFSATQLLSQRDQVSDRIRSALAERAGNFWIRIDNLAITELTFGREYLDAIEQKQVAQQ
jgi:regulator of protease activity HflC (stomatin/prohibitin superfamily)